MAYHSAEEMKQILDQCPKWQDKLYCRGFLLSNQENLALSEYPFYGNWHERNLVDHFRLIHHKDTYAHVYSGNGRTYFLVGHAYDPIHMEVDEINILSTLDRAMENGIDAFWEAESNLTGVFCVGYIQDGHIYFSTDCAGMQIVYYGAIQDKFYITSHSKLVADLQGLEQDPYIVKLTNNRFFKYFGNWLPGDLSPYSSLKRLQSNHCAIYTSANHHITVERYYPFRKIETVSDEESYRETIKELGDIILRSMELIARKWPDKKIAISVTGGQDSQTTLACSNGNYHAFDYFSYISNDAESVDAYAAHSICSQLGLEHSIHEIATSDDLYTDIEVVRKIMECNAGCIGKNNANDVRKRYYYAENPHFDLEVKSWVNEVGRARFYKRYGKNRFPTKLTASYCRTLYKICFNPGLIHKSNIVFKNYLEQYYNDDVFERIPWPDLLYWEFIWGSGEGLFLTSEHRTSYEITIPFNNRRYLEKMLSVSLEKRKEDIITRDIIAHKNPKLAACNISVKDVGYTDFRTALERGYLEIFSKISI